MTGAIVASVARATCPCHALTPRDEPLWQRQEVARHAVIDDSLLVGAGTLATAGLVFNILCGQEMLAYLPRITLGLSCFGLQVLAIWLA